MPLLLASLSLLIAAAALLIVALVVIIGFLRQDRAIRRMQREIAQRVPRGGQRG